MTTVALTSDTLLFLDFKLQPQRRQLERAGQPVVIGDRAFDLLVMLAQHSGAILSNRVLMDGVWPNLIVEEVNVRAQIKALRKILGGGCNCPHVVNVTGRGYCFTAPVQRIETPHSALFMQPQVHQFVEITA